MSEPGPSSHHHHHRREAAVSVATAVITVSDTRTLESDSGGALVAELLGEANHPVVSREIVRDEPEAIASALRGALARSDVRAVIFTGGTGVTRHLYGISGELTVVPEPSTPLLCLIALGAVLVRRRR